MKYLLTLYKKQLFYILLLFWFCVSNTILAGNRKAGVPNRQYYDSIFAKSTGDTIPVSLPRIISLHTNIIDWVITTPNVTVEMDLSRLQRSCYSILITGKYNPKISNNTINSRWVYNVTSIKGEVRKYWRTGNLEEASIPYSIEPDTTLWGPFKKISYFRRRHLSGRYVKNPRYWRAYYLGLYAAYNKFSICLDGSGKQGDAISFGVSAGFSVPLYKHHDGSGWDLDLGFSVGAMITSFDKYEYYRESACYVYTETKPRHLLPYPMFQDIHISLAYRFRTIEKKALYGATRFMLREERRALREEYRRRLIAEKFERKDSVTRYSDIRSTLSKANEQLALYSDSASYYYTILRGAIEYTEKNIEDLRFDDDWKFKRDILSRNLNYYMKVANDFAPDHLRTDREARAKARAKEEKLRQEEERKKAKEAEKAAKKAEKIEKENNNKVTETQEMSSSESVDTGSATEQKDDEMSNSESTIKEEGKE